MEKENNEITQLNITTSSFYCWCIWTFNHKIL